MTTTSTTNSTTIRNDILAVTDGTTQAGAVVWWELSGSVDILALDRAWKGAGLDPKILPEAIAPKTALRRAMQSLSEKRKLVRPLSGQEGYSLVNETAEGENLNYEQSVTATVDAIGSLRVTPRGGHMGDLVESSFVTKILEFSTSDISDMLVDFTGSLQSVALRTRGGFYFLPPDSVGKFRAAVAILKSVSGHSFYEIPALQTTSAVEAILAAVYREAEAEIAEFEQVLQDGAGQRALRTKVRNCEKVASKVSTYEKLLGTSLSELQDKLAGLRARLSEAAIVAAMDATE